jgi:hypothetical protein
MTDLLFLEKPETLAFPPPALAPGVKPAKNEPPRTDFARVTYLNQKQ